MSLKAVKICVLTLISVFLFGCADGPLNHATKFTTYEDFQAGPEGGVDLVWARIGLRDPERLHKKLMTYDSVVIDKVMVIAEEDSLDKEQIEELVAYTIDRLTAKISPYKPVVDVPTDNSLRLSIALSNVETPNPILAVTSSVLPYGLVISSISKLTTGAHTNVGSATIELLVSDASTDQPIFAAIDNEGGNKDFATMIDSLDDAKDAINFWVDRLGVTLQEWKKPD